MGVFSAIGDWQARNRQEQLQQRQQLEQQQYDLQQQRAQALLGQQQQANAQSYQPLLRQLPTTAAAALGPLLTSQDPRLQAMGQQQLQEYQRRGSPETRQGLAANQQGMDIQGRQQAQADALYPGQRQMQGLQIQGQQQANLPPAAPAPMSRGQQLAQAWEADTGAKMPAGMRPQLRATPDGRAFVDAQPIEGTPAYQTAQEGMDDLEKAIAENERFRDKLAEVGTEYRGADANLLNESRAILVSHFGNAMMKLGVLQPGDLARVDAALPDPTSFGNQLNPAAAGNIMQAYDQLGQQMTEQLQKQRDRNWFIPKRAVTPAERAKARKASNGR